MINSGSADLIEWLENPIEDVVPDGWLSCDEISKRTRKSEATVRKKLREGVRNGSILRKVFRTECGQGLIRPVPHYFIKGLKIEQKGTVDASCERKGGKGAKKKTQASTGL